MSVLSKQLADPKNGKWKEFNITSMESIMEGLLHFISMDNYSVQASIFAAAEKAISAFTTKKEKTSETFCS